MVSRWGQRLATILEAGQRKRAVSQAYGCPGSKAMSSQEWLGNRFSRTADYTGVTSIIRWPADYFGIVCLSEERWKACCFRSIEQRRLVESFQTSAISVMGAHVVRTRGSLEGSALLYSWYNMDHSLQNKPESSEKSNTLLLVSLLKFLEPSRICGLPDADVFLQISHQ